MIEDRATSTRGPLRSNARLLLCIVLLSTTLRGDPGITPAPPSHLADTGLYSDFATRTVSTANLVYSPQYPLWSDGAAKKRWVYLPPGEKIDASQPDNWVFPIGTKFWKEFTFGKRVETRLLEKTASDRWTFATYAWNEDESDAVLVPDRGLRNYVEISPGIRHDIPGVSDCKACHEGQGRDVVLGFNALQLSPERDPNAPHAEPVAPEMVDLPTLAEQGRLANLPGQILKEPPRIDAPSPRARAALGYLWANCGGCHNASDPLSSVGMVLRFPVTGRSQLVQPELTTVIGQTSKFQIPGLADSQSFRICPGDPSRSSLAYRMGSRNPFRQMPPLGTKMVDQDALNLISEWIREDLGSYSAAKK